MNKNYQISFSTFYCRYRHDYRIGFSEEIPGTDREVLKSFFIIRNREQSFNKKQYIYINIENVVFLALENGAVLFASINNDNSDRGLTRYEGIYITYEQLEIAWYFMDNILLRFMENVECLDNMTLSGDELFSGRSSINFNREFVYNYFELKEEVLHNREIRSFAIGFQLNTLPLQNQLALYECGIQKDKCDISKEELSIEELKRFFGEEMELKEKNPYISKNTYIAIWQLDRRKKFFDKDYRLLCKDIKRMKKKMNVCIWSVEKDGNQVGMIQTEQAYVKPENLINEVEDMLWRREMNENEI